MSTSFVDAKSTSKSNQAEPEDIELHLMLTIWFCCLRSNTGQDAIARSFRNKNNSNNLSEEEVVYALSETYEETKAKIEENIPEPKKSERVVINENNLKQSAGNNSTEFDKINNVLSKYNYNKYSKIYLHVIVPTDNEMAFGSAYTLVKCFGNDCLKKYDKIDANKSDINILYFIGNSSKQNQTDEISDEKPTDCEAKIAAIMSHYVYFYLDWLEYVHYQQNGIEKYKRTSIDIEKEFPYLSKENADGNGLFKDGMLALPFGDTGKDKIKLRIVNRLKEIKVASKEFKGDLAEAIAKILSDCRKQGRPMEFYQLYDAFNYWDSIENDVKMEAQKWFVSHPSIVAESIQKGSSYNKFLFIKWKKGEVFNLIENPLNHKPLVYNSVLTHGMSNVSGYGGLLFVKLKHETQIEANYAVKFAYCHKGTDVNSLNDWVLVDALQGLTGLSLQHFHSVKNGITLDKKIRKYNTNTPFFFCGHSLGGGLASSCAIVAKGRHAITFNAAGLNFLGSLWTRIVGSITNFNLGALHPTAIAKRVHPIRIKGEVVDEILKLARIITGGLSERAYGSDPLILDFHDGFLSETANKHGINNFLYNSVLSQIRIVDKSTIIHPVNSKGPIKNLSLNDIHNNLGELKFVTTQDIKALNEFARAATDFQKKYSYI